MEGIKTDLFPGNLRAGKRKERMAEEEYPQKNIAEFTEPISPVSRPGKDSAEEE